MPLVPLPTYDTFDKLYMTNGYDEFIAKKKIYTINGITKGNVLKEAKKILE